MSKASFSKIAKKFTKRRAARFFAVQALYQTEHSDQPLSFLLDEFTQFHITSEQQQNVASHQDTSLFMQLVEGVMEHQDSIDSLIQSILTHDWSIARLDAVVRAILRASAYEITRMHDTPLPVIINEYLEIAKAFFTHNEVNFIHAALDKMGQSVRSVSSSEHA